MDVESDVYRKLQQHLDKMPVGYPATGSGVELRLLEFLFTPEQARIALGLDYRLRSAEQILEHVPDLGISLEELRTALEAMVDRGNTFSKKLNGITVYAAMPFVVGMVEMQQKRLTPQFLQDTGEYFQEKFAAAYVGTGVPQSRVIPVGKSITAEHRVGIYDELKDVIEKAEDRIRVGACVCRESMNMAGRACRVTRRQETCMAFRDFADLMGRTGWGRPISKEEALEIAAKNEEDGLVLQPANEQEAQFFCSCCGDCCGILRIAKAMPRPVSIIASNYFAAGNPDLCVGCGTCVERCQMEAIKLEDNIAVVIPERCIGCGLCVPTCPSEAVHLVKKEQELTPPRDMEALYEAMMADKNG